MQQQLCITIDYRIQNSNKRVLQKPLKELSLETKEMAQFVKKHRLPQLTQYEKDNMTSPTTIRKLNL